MSAPSKMAAPMRHVFRVSASAIGARHLPLITSSSSRHISQSSLVLNSSPGAEIKQFNEKLLEHLCCPLSKKPLRYDKEKNELISDEIGVAYPIVNGIPNLIPQDARRIQKQSSEES